MTHEERLQVARALGYLSFVLDSAEAYRDGANVRVETEEAPFARGLYTGLKTASSSMIKPLRDAIALLDPLWKVPDHE